MFSDKNGLYLVAPMSIVLEQQINGTKHSNQWSWCNNKLTSLYKLLCRQKNKLVPACHELVGGTALQVAAKPPVNARLSWTDYRIEQ